MKILVDENIPLISIRWLTESGHDIKDLRKTPEQGLPDEDIWEMTQQEGRLLITTDKGFARYRYQSHNGILIVRLKQPNRLKIHSRIIQAFEQVGHSATEWNNLIVVMRDKLQSKWKYSED